MIFKKFVLVAYGELFTCSSNIMLVTLKFGDVNLNAMIISVTILKH